VIQLGLNRTQTGLDVAQALAKRELRKRHAQELIATRESSCSKVAPITPHAGVELVPRKNLHQLREYQLAGVHAIPFAPLNRSKVVYYARPN
jgi:hypothetical protein